MAFGDHNIVQPKKSNKAPVPVVVHFHGARETAATVTRNQEMMKPFLGRGCAVIASNSLGREGHKGGFWSFIPGRPTLRNKLTFTHQVLDDTVAKFGNDRDQLLLTGFSIGGSLTWYLAYQTPTNLAAYSKIAESFWRPHPTVCSGPIKMLRTHSWVAPTVPLDGRPIWGGLIDQYNIFQGL
jgi:polyhydroxybutyrate depolymerase